MNKNLTHIFFALSILISSLIFWVYGSKTYPLYGDALGYYSYLPSAFLIHNLDSITKFPEQSDVPEGVKNYFQSYEINNQKSKKGYYINQYTIGMALCESPFFFTQCFINKIRGIQSYGYSEEFIWMINISNFFYLILGLFFTYKCIRFYYTREISLISISTLLLASNLLWFGFIQRGMAHIPLFFFHALSLYASLNILKTNKTKYYFILGFSLGLTVLIRPPEILFGIVPLFIFLSGGNIKQLSDTFLKNLRKGFLLFGTFTFIICLQLIFWKVYSGSFLYNSYQGQYFHWLDPQIIKGLFGPMNGWLLYNPVFMIALPFFFFHRKLRILRPGAWLYLILIIYVNYSWECYMYINGFGSRPMIHTYPLWAFAIAQMFTKIFSLSFIFRIFWGIVLSITFYTNIHFSILNVKNLYWSEASNYPYFLNMFFKNKLSYNDLVLYDTQLKQPDSNHLQKIKNVGFIQASREIPDSRLVWDSSLKDSVLRFENNVESPDMRIRIPFEELNNPSNSYLRATAIVKFMHYSDPYQGNLLVMNLKNENDHIFWKAINLCTKSGLPDNRFQASDSIKMHRNGLNIWDSIDFFIPLKTYKHQGVLECSFWNLSKRAFYFKSLSLDLYQEK